MATSAALRPINQARIMSTLRRGSWSRVALADQLGLNRSTVTVIVSSLLEQGLVRELDAAPRGAGSTGRPRTGIALDPSGAYFGGLELGNDSLTAVVSDLTGTELARASEPSRPEEGVLVAEERVCSLLAGIAGGRRLRSIGLTVPGIVTAHGRLDWAPTLGWRDTSLGDTVRARFGVDVHVENDANAAALAEEQFRDSAEGDNLLLLLLSSGVGAGLLVGRQLYRGGAGRVGESGHIRLPLDLASEDASGEPVSVEDLLGRAAVLTQYRAWAGSNADWTDLVADLEAGKPAVQQLRDRWQTTLGWLAGTLAWTLDPDVIVFGGLLSALLESGSTALQKSLQRHGPAGITNSWRLSSLGPQGDPLGAVALSLRAFFAIPPLLGPDRALTSMEAAS